MKSYDLVSHHTDNVDVDDYVQCAVHCLRPIVEIPGNLCHFAVRYAVSVWTLCYTACMLGLTPCTVALTVVYITYFVMHEVPTKRKVKKAYKHYCDSNDKYRCIRHSLEAFMRHRETNHVRRTDWQSIHVKHYNSCSFQADKLTVVSATALLLYLYLMYLTAPRDIGVLTLALLFSSYADIRRVLDTITHMLIPSDLKKNVNATFPKIMNILKGLRHLKGLPVSVSLPNPLEIELPQTLPFSDQVVCCKQIRDSTSVIVSNVDIVRINQGDRIVFCGTSGCGKSTLLQMTLGMTSVHDGRVYDGNFQWIGEGVSSSLDYKYLSICRLLDLDCPSARTEITAATELTEAHLRLIDAFQLRTLKERTDLSEDKFLDNASAGEKNRLHAMACVWIAMQNPDIQLVCWDEGEQGLEPDMFVDILHEVHVLLAGKTLVLISHCVEAQNLTIWD